MKQIPQTPRWVNWLLDKYSRRELLESIEGDLHEVFLEEVEEYGLQRARRRYVWHALAFLRHNRLRNRNYSKTQNNMDLLTNYLKVSVRDIRRHRVFSAINLFGLITGFTALIFILQFVLFEISFDRFHKKSDQVYRVLNARYQNGQLVQFGAITYPTVGPTLTKDYPEVEAYTRLTVGGRNYLTYQEELYMMENYLWADEHFLEVFDFPVLHGEKQTALSEPATVVMTRSFARRFLANGQKEEDLVGKSITVNDWDFPCTVTAIVADVPARSHLQFDVLISYKTFIRLAGNGADNSWEWSDFYHYIVLAKGTDPGQFQAKLDEFGQKYFKNGEVSGAQETFELQAMDAVHLDDTLQYEYAKVTDGGFVQLMLVIALLIVSIAWINYINITTSRALQRAKEVGIRKVLGAYRKQLVGQFLTESFLVNILALFMAVALVLLLQPFFNELVTLPLGISLFTNSVLGVPFVLWFVSLFLLAVLLIGLYPAFLISRFKTEEVVKGKFGLVGDMVNLRKALVVAQFVAALVLISGSVAVYRQIDYMRSQDLGMNIDNNLVIYGPDLRPFDANFIGDFEKFKTELMAKPGIISVTATQNMFGNGLPKSFRIHSPMDPDRNDLSSNWMAVDFGFFDHFGVELLAGRTFRRSDHHTNGDDVNTVILNASALDLFRFSSAEEAIGQKIEIEGRYQPMFEIVGVVKNFHQRSLKESIQPIMLLPFYDNSQFIAIKYAAGMEDRAVEVTRQTYADFYPGNYFDYYFLEDHFNRQYKEDERIGTLSAIFTVLAIVLAVLGLYGLVLITLMKKTKEIGVRKVLGADMFSLLGLYGKHFLFLVGIAVAIGLPVSYMLIRDFLQNYSYTPGVEIAVLLVGAGSLVIICALTVLLQTRRITANNPVDSLRYE